MTYSLDEAERNLELLWRRLRPNLNVWMDDSARLIAGRHGGIKEVRLLYGIATNLEREEFLGQLTAFEPGVVLFQSTNMYQKFGGFFRRSGSTHHYRCIGITDKSAHIEITDGPAASGGLRSWDSNIEHNLIIAPPRWGTLRPWLNEWLPAP